MYFPYLRGKQFELIALRELCTLLPYELRKSSPIIEPVKNSSTFKSTVKELAQKDINFNIIINPRVGDIKYSKGAVVEALNSSLNGYSNYQLAIIVDSITDQNIGDLITYIQSIDIEFNGFTLIHYSEISNDSIKLLHSELDIKYNVIYFSKTSRRYYREFPRETLVSLDDYFKDQNKNADYLNKESNFSREYRFYKEDGFVGFSDFLTIGDNYSESGFLPRAVAIHISHLNNNEGMIMVKHFVSDSNEDTSDIGGKFSEAITKLVSWSQRHQINTEAIKIFRSLEESGHFPGLGSIKKLSIMNHIELITKNL
jgi:hypothetical protein